MPASSLQKINRRIYQTLPQELANQFRSRSIGLDDGTIAHAVEGGNGKPLVLLHGYPQSWRVWHRVMPTLVQNHHVIALDLPGLAGSDSLSIPHTTVNVARWVSQVLKKVGVSEAVQMVGHDLGAWVGIAYASDAPDALEQLVLLDSALPGVTPDSFFQLRHESPMWHFHVHANRAAVDFLLKGREHDYITWFMKRRRLNALGLLDEHIDYYAKMYAEPHISDSGFDYYRCLLVSAQQVRASLSEKTFLKPTLVLGGESARGKAMLEEAKLLLPNATGGKLNGVIMRCGHYIPEEAPEQLLHELSSFLNT